MDIATQYILSVSSEGTLRNMAHLSGNYKTCSLRRLETLLPAVGSFCEGQFRVTVQGFLNPN